MNALSQRRREAQIERTETRILTMYETLKRELVVRIERLVSRHLDNFSTCRDPYVIVKNVVELCRTIMDNASCDFSESDYAVVRDMLTFKNFRGETSPLVAKFVAMGIRAPVVQHVRDALVRNDMNLFDVSDRNQSRIVFWQVTMDAEVRRPLPKRQKVTRLSSPSYSPTYSPTSPPRSTTPVPS